MTQFRKVWTTFIDAIKPQLMREHEQAGPVFIDTRPFTVTSFAHKDR